MLTAEDVTGDRGYKLDRPRSNSPNPAKKHYSPFLSFVPNLCDRLHSCNPLRKLDRNTAEIMLKIGVLTIDRSQPWPLPLQFGGGAAQKLPFHRGAGASDPLLRLCREIPMDLFRLAASGQLSFDPSSSFFCLQSNRNLIKSIP